MTAATTPSPAISWDGVAVDLGGHPIVHDVSIDVPAGDWLSVVGPNGAGKTTLLRALTGSVRPVRGRVTIDGDDVTALHPRQRARRLAVVPQIPTVPPGISTFDYVALGRVPHQGFRLAPSLEDRRRTLAVLQRLGLDRFANRRVDTLSGGERQQVVLARALVQEASVLVLDEPTTALDVGHQLDVLELVADLRAERTLTVVTTVHDLSLAGQFADTIAVIAEGRLAAHGTPTEVLTAEVISRHWGVDAAVSREVDGTVTVTVRRRRERIT